MEKTLLYKICLTYIGAFRTELERLRVLVGCVEEYFFVI